MKGPGVTWTADKFATTIDIINLIRAGIFKQSMGARNRVGIGLSYLPGFIGWRNSFLGIDFWAP
jgi:hypothetical protein